MHDAHPTAPGSPVRAATSLLSVLVFTLTAVACRTSAAALEEDLWPGVDGALTALAAPAPPTVAADTGDREFIAAIRRGAALAPAPPPAPAPVPQRVAPAPGLQVDPAAVFPGGVIPLRIHGAPDLELRGRLAGYEFRFQKGASFYWALVGLDPWVKPGTHSLQVDSVDLDGNQGRATVLVVVASVSYPEESVALPASAGGPLSAGARAEFDQVEGLVRRYTSQKLWEGTFQMPVAGQTSSVFGARRTYSGRPADGQHTGWDLAAPHGAPVTASNQGRVVFAGPLLTRGNTIILDHGLGVHSLYLHLSRILVGEGDAVDRGQQIGLVGSTGLATGPHLHWEVRVGGATVDPALWLQHAYGE
ncbi:MAG: M23 family metallopeptidase [Chloroflexi bacterium]|nr:M23 family metallopeptidase [Chloroflexota bacterium]